MDFQRGDRVVIHMPGQPEDGWGGTVSQVTRWDVVVYLDRRHPTCGSSISLQRAQLRREPEAR